MPTATWKSRLRSGSAHCDLQLAVEVRQCPLGSGARGGGPAVPTARRRRRVRRRRSQRRRRRTALIKSNNPHLAGGELRFGKPMETSSIPMGVFFPSPCLITRGYGSPCFCFDAPDLIVILFTHKNTVYTEILVPIFLGIFRIPDCW